MEDFRRQFSTESIKNLKNRKVNLQNAVLFSEPEKRELYRTLHTVKGSSQTFGFAAAGRLAHKLEGLLSAESEEIFTNKNLKNLFLEGIELLIESLLEKHFEIPAPFTEKIDIIFPNSTEKNKLSETPLPEIPPEISSQLSSQEKTRLDSALSGGKNLYGLEVGFEAADFARRFKNLREILSRSCEIIATFPSQKFNALGKIGFQIIFVSSLPGEQIRATAEENQARVIFDTSETVFSNDLQGITSQVVKHGQTIAKKFGKQIEFLVSTDEVELSAKKLKLIFDVLIHLTRNAVDHAVRSEGKIEISLRIEENNLKLAVSDNGRGIDLRKIKAKAVERKIISADRDLSEQETLDLIFLPEFSTASELTEISGRGIGLDAVKTAVEAARGTVSVKSQNRKGTTFEIFLPNAVTS